MQKTKNDKNPYSIFAGIDISKEYFDVTLIDKLGKKLAYERFSNDSKGIAKFIQWLLEELNLDVASLLLCMEHTGLYSRQLMLKLLEEQMNVWVESSLQIKKSSGLLRGKTDKIDSYRIALYASLYGFRAKTAETEDKRLLHLQDLLSSRSRLLKFKLSLSTSIAELKRVDPISGKVVEKAQKATLAGLSKSLKAIEKCISEAIGKEEDIKGNYELATSVKGVGMILAAQLIVYTHNFKRINKARQLACYCGVAPFSYESGTSIRAGNHVSKFANNTLKSTLHLASISSIQHNPDMKEYFYRKVAEGKPKMVVLNAVRNKLLRHVLATVKSGEKYEIF